MPQLGAGAQLVRAYGPAGFRIGQESYAGHVLVLPAQTLAWSGELTIEALAPILVASRQLPVASAAAVNVVVPPSIGGMLAKGHQVAPSSHITPPPQPSPYEGGGSSVVPLAQSKEGFIELLIIGTGKRHEMIAPELRGALKERGVAVETMDTGAACRTFNVLLGEGRRVAAALLLPER